MRVEKVEVIPSNLFLACRYTMNLGFLVLLKAGVWGSTGVGGGGGGGVVFVAEIRARNTAWKLVGSTTD
ncbi:hypothetical protein QC762_0081230 [Podospora pseudocomata]|uniref:Uncharacterized protein n=1 Tax=Podospora pseudocomata TaxID=2093779 RepID=A0ABR0GC72_9PEZI|nr:hypothetical protein QC762_0081230 [Podospora pseudocomata]